MRLAKTSISLTACIAILAAVPTVATGKTTRTSTGDIHTREINSSKLQDSLKGFTAIDKKRGSKIKIYFDQSSRDVASEALPDILDILAEGAKFTGIDPKNVQWSAIAFTSDEAYTPPLHEVRWVVQTTHNGKLAKQGEHQLYTVIPHEEIHAIQKSRGGKLPAWFIEGQAEWAARQIVQDLFPERSHGRDKIFTHADDKTGPQIELSDWSGATVSFKMDAETAKQIQTDGSGKKVVITMADGQQMPTIKLTPEQIKRLTAAGEKGTQMTFNVDDAEFGNIIVERYKTARDLFVKTESAVGISKMHEWFRQIHKLETVTTEQAADLATTSMDLDIKPWLK